MTTPPISSLATEQKHGSGSPQFLKVAQDLEATFLAEMLKSAGFGKTNTQFNGGPGEEQFSSMLVDAHAKSLTQAGGIGLTEAIMKSLMEIEND